MRRKVAVLGLQVALIVVLLALAALVYVYGPVVLFIPVIAFVIAIATEDTGRGS